MPLGADVKIKIWVSDTLFCRKAPKVKSNILLSDSLMFHFMFTLFALHLYQTGKPIIIYNFSEMKEKFGKTYFVIK